MPKARNYTFLEVSEEVVRYPQVIHLKGDNQRSLKDSGQVGHLDRSSVYAASAPIWEWTGHGQVGFIQILVYLDVSSRW